MRLSFPKKCGCPPCVQNQLGTEPKSVTSSAVVVNMVVKDKKGSVVEGKGKSKEAAKEESKCICEICTCG